MPPIDGQATTPLHPSRRFPGMDAVNLLLEDHQKVKNLFFDFEMAPLGQPEARRAIAERIIRELMVHERIEEEIFYPAFRNMLGGQGKETVEHSKEEHALVDSLIEQLSEIDLDDPGFDGLMRILRENVEHHIQDEETKMLPLARERMATELDGLGADMVEYKQTLLRELDAQDEARKAGTPKEKPAARGQRR
jgi:hypothetical protein